MMAQMFFDRCPFALKQVMNSLAHNTHQQGVRTDLIQMPVYLDNDDCKNKPELQLYKEPELSQKRTPQAAATAVGVVSMHTTNSSNLRFSRLGTKDDFLVIMKVPNYNTASFETLVTFL